MVKNKMIQQDCKTDKMESSDLGKRLFAKTKSKVFCKNTNNHVGFNIIWNTNEFGTIWFQKTYGFKEIFEVANEA
jgi:hypothetical protein